MPMSAPVDTRSFAEIVLSIEERLASSSNSEAVLLARRQEFLDALENYPIDNRRRGEHWHNTFTRGESRRPNPPKKDAPFIHGSLDGCCRLTAYWLKLDFPQEYETHGAGNVHLALLDRVSFMEKVRVSGYDKEGGGGGARTVKDWDLNRGDD